MTISRGVQASSPRPQLLEPPRELQALAPPPFTTPINQSPNDSHIWKGVGGVRPVPVIPHTDELWASLRRSAQNSLSRNTNKMQICNRIYYSKVYWRLNMFRVVHRSSSVALNPYLQPLVYIPIWWPAVAKAESALATAGHHMGI